MSEACDVVVIGAGAVGCAVAERLTRTGRTVVVLERNGDVGLEASRRNSGVLHTGLHLPPRSRKATHARAGARLALDWCAGHGVPVRQCGMHVVVAPGDLTHLVGELPGFFALVRRARAQGIPITLRTSGGVRAAEPAIRCAFGIQIPDAAIVDAPAFVRSLEVATRAQGAQFVFGATVVGLHVDGRAHVVETTQRAYRARAVVNAAGIGAAPLAAVAGFPQHRVTLYRGEYYEVTDPGLHSAIRGLVYPVYRPGSPGLGIHLTPTMDGRLLVGPNARKIERLEDVDVERTPPEMFLDAVRPFCPDITREMLQFAYAGIRTKRDEGTREPDFHIELDREDPPLVNCIGIESPGLTAAMAIGMRVDELLAPAFEA